jgi:hypothetical protein
MERRRAGGTQTDLADCGCGDSGRARDRNDVTTLNVKGLSQQDQG